MTKQQQNAICDWFEYFLTHPGERVRIGYGTDKGGTFTDLICGSCIVEELDADGVKFVKEVISMLESGPSANDVKALSRAMDDGLARHKEICAMP